VPDIGEVRALGADQAGEIAELATVCEIAETGVEDPELVDWIRGGAGKPRFRAFGCYDEAGLAGFAYLELAPGSSAVEVELRVRPGLDPSVGLPLLTAARQSAAAFDPALPVQLMTNESAVRHRAWLESIGACEVRRFWRMAIDFDDARPCVPAPPAGVVVRRAGTEEADLRQIFSLVDTSFAEHFGHTDQRTYETWIEVWRERESFDLSLWWVAELDGDPVAVLLGLTFPGIGHVATLGTLKQARGRGIGTHLLHTAFAEFHDRGLRRVTLGVDSENGTGAVRLYESVGMHAINVWPLYELPPLPIAR
jgi:ribosomal protein S18 acetylase RimI-like enzyme